MEFIAILIGLILLAAMAFYVSRPLVQHRHVMADGTALQTLEIQRDAVYSQIRELDMDHATGKANDDDYQRLRGDLVTQATNLLKQIDGVLAAPPIDVSAPAAALAPEVDEVEALIAARRKAVQAAPARSVEAELEAAIAARRKTQAPSRPIAPARSADDEVEALIASRRKTSVAPVSQPARQAKLACPNCGKPITTDDAFCSKCGTALPQQPVF